MAKSPIKIKNKDFKIEEEQLPLLTVLEEIRKELRGIRTK